MDFNKDSCNWSDEDYEFIEEHYAVINRDPIIRKWEEWELINTPMTADDLLDTVLFIKRIKER
jgi:hypothetical protein